MKFIVVRKVGIVLFSSLCFSLVGAECEMGKTSFESTVHKKIMRDCAECHGGQKKAPAFAVADPATSYYRVLNYVSFSNLFKSTLIERAGNSHCEKSNCDVPSGVEMQSLVRKWWAEGQKSCPADSAFFTTEQDLPPLDSRSDAGFQTMKWDLKTISTKWEGYYLTLEVKRYVKPTSENPGAYLFRKPRLWGDGKSVYIKDLKIYVNHVYDGMATNFTMVNATVSPSLKTKEVPYPLLSSDTQVVIQQTDKDQISVGFGSLEPKEAPVCKKVQQFEETVSREFTAANCVRCHGQSSSSGSTGKREAHEFFRIEPKGMIELCQNTLQRLPANLASLKVSPLVLLPVHGRFEHPKVVDDVEGYVSALKIWALEEAK